MTISIDLQNDCQANNIPDEVQFTLWITHALQNKVTKAEICIRIVDKAEMARLNETYRAKAGPTNILSFPVPLLPSVAEVMPMHGDLVICSDIVREEAIANHKSELAHWAHLTIHGTLHLLGYDHIEEEEAEVMESLEIDILHALGYANPYGDD